jgi:hypothetical protein
VGDPCIPDEEHRQDFAGFGITEANVESGSLACETRVCLVNHFQGRVSCPYGQDDLSLPDADPATAVTVPVDAWDADRKAADAVYCSCRCDGPDPNGRYCECPSGFVCAELVPRLGLGREQLEGSYCVKRGTEFSTEHPGGPTCASAPEDCSGEPFVNP